MKTTEANHLHSCCLCTEISSGRFPSEYQGTYQVGSRVCFETADFVVLPTLSPLCAGHVLILPRLHVTNLAALPDHMRQAVKECAREVTSRLSKFYGSEFYFFEHGVTGSGQACGIDHAHLHILPLTVNIVAAVESRLEADFPSQDATTLVHVLSLADQLKTTSYLLYGANLDLVKISFSDRIPSQYMRRLIVHTECRSEWDWKFLSGQAEFLATCEAFGRL